jgi:putative aldouronate transport system substrate-binding protein
MPREVVKPDLPATDGGVPAVYYKYPASPAKINDATPGDGGTVKAFNWLAGAAPPDLDKNSYWQELNTRLGVKLDISFTPSADYAARVATTVAGGDLPDLMPLSVSDVPQIDQLLKAKFQDLSQWLSGPAIVKYPNLAALPTSSWRNVIYNGGIYAVPYSLPVAQSIPMVRKDILDKLNLPTPTLADGMAFLDFCQSVTDAAAQQWAFGNFNAPLQMAQAMAGVPNEWRVESGKFISMYQTDE